MFQERSIFPGHAAQGRPETRFPLPPGGEMLRLTADGAEIAGLFCPSLRGPSRHAPTVLLFYGNGMCLADLLPLIEDLRQLGFNVAGGDYPGYGLSGGKPSEQGCYAMAQALWEHLKARPDLDSQRLLLMGISLGGGVAVELAVQTGLACAGLILLSTFTSLTDMAKRQFPFVPRWYVRHRFESLKKMPQVKAPVLIIHGRQDRLVPFFMGEALRDAAGARCYGFLAIDDAAHNDLFARANDQILAEVTRFAATVSPPEW